MRTVARLFVVLSACGLVSACSSTDPAESPPTGADASVEVSIDVSIDAAVDAVVDTALCPASTRECLDDRVGRICPSDGAGWVPFACREGEKCDKGACALEPKTPACTAGKTECVSATMLRTCTPDGESWLPSACDAGLACVDGACKLSATSTCVPDTGTCVSGAPFRCKADGSGWTTSTCPTGTTCDKGSCRGSACLAGESSCIVDFKSGITKLRTCTADGSSLTESLCAADEACVSTGATTAACKKGVCAPGSTVCGSKADSTADPTKYVSTCTLTGDGYKWVVSKCDGLLTCDTKTGPAACSVECVPGATRCEYGPIGTLSIVTCGTDGKWGTPAACTSGKTCSYDPSTSKSACIDPKACVEGTSSCQYTTSGALALSTCTGGKWSTPTLCPSTTGPQTCIGLSPTKAVCGDSVCAAAGGTCTSDAKFRPCKDGKLVAETDAIACPSGGYCSGGYCAPPECQEGESRCATPTGYQACTLGRWSPTITSCPATDGGIGKCSSGMTGTGLRKTACGDACVVGTRSCGPAGDGGTSSTTFRACGTDGKWGASETCSFGACSEKDGSCVAECVPGTGACTGSYVPAGETGQMGFTHGSACSPTGVLQPMTACAPGTWCRRGPYGYATTMYGCVECVGDRNEAGFTDVKCGSGGTVTCTTSNKWSTATAACPSGSACVPASYAIPAYCDTVVAPPDGGLPDGGGSSPCNDCIGAMCSKEVGQCIGFVDAGAPTLCLKYLSCAATCSGMPGCLTSCSAGLPLDPPLSMLSSCATSSCSKVCG